MIEYKDSKFKESNGMFGIAPIESQSLVSLGEVVTTRNQFDPKILEDIKMAYTQESFS